MISETAKRMRAGAVSQRNMGWVPLPVYGDEFYTPPRIVAALGRFDFDPCAGPCQVFASAQSHCTDSAEDHAPD